ncbi:MAG TPA: UDP-N-acetylglucosamine 2-epimerase (non-hydrolyzing) [Tahibacter sp.]|uniref:non-hydrolyzing UDP-N-acetylglucosamine 2-epimerase n=1 Tax=Tahibacter sp. TaxID=2056211 RepID=UPI002CBDEAF8|nr:UDP-N-acetylglucosamine 2-epimerase (non-hydrolyzing) [Tahibacter sp.]HSX62507.1 UDP-N-acetylglucosamine 2-epimerase (non-hydrolyzing) [Tahibacter sp.]
MTPPRRRVLVVAGTRPECLKLASIVRALRAEPALDTQLLNSGQHEAMVERTFGQLGLACDLSAGQIAAASLSHALSALRVRIRDIARAQRSTLVVSQGDTSTAYAAALAARDLGLPLAHVEAGLRTSHPYRPFPEELFRRRIAPIAQLHFAPTRQAALNLRGEGVPDARIFPVGNSVIDLLREQVEDTRPLALPFLPDTPRLIALTLHRRENYGRGLDLVCAAVLELLARHPDIGVVCPVHPNPTVGHRIRRHLSTHPRISLVDPLDYRPFIAVLARACLAITDSGGIQEEAPYLGTPVLVVRENTERPESVALGAATLVPLRTDRIVAEADRLLAAPPPAQLAFTPDAAYGDGRSGERIARVIAGFTG